MYQLRYINKNFLINKGIYDEEFDIDQENINISLPHNKYFDMDILDNKFNIVKSKAREIKHIGFFSTSATTTFGKTKSGKKIYQVTSLNHRLPHFRLTYGGKMKGKILVVFKFIHWKEKLPQATIIDVIGLFNEENIIKSYIYHFNLSLKKAKIKPKINHLESSINRINDEGLYTVSIDPYGSKDIDDAISIDTNFIYIHIAQPISYVDRDEIIELAKTRFSTLYLGNREISLFGDIITNQASLLEGQSRNCYTLKFNKKGELITHYPGTVCLNKNLSYQHVNNNLDQFSNLFEFSKNVFGNLISSQKLVEKWMIHSNCSLGNILDKTIYRNNLTNMSLIKDLDENNKKYFFDSSKYIFCNESSHNILQKKNYLHFTSPIRRMVDNFIHYQLTYNTMMLDDKFMKNFMINLNELSLQSSRFHRTLQLREVITKLDKINIINGTVMSVTDTYINLMIPNLGIFKHYIVNKYGKVLDTDKIKPNQTIKLNVGIINNIFPNNMILISTEFDLDLISPVLAVYIAS
tara:strand:- start:2030 stop:3595 length:1566 start_codon:yes stop_codon:yes gene_type:complete